MDQGIPLLSAALRERYEPLAVAGFGAFSIVVRARDLQTGETVAVKRLSTRGGDKRKFFGELRVVLRLAHPHIVKCLDLWDGEEDTGELVFEFADGGSLRDRMPEGEIWSPETALRTVRPVADALAYAHGKGIVHRDVKPENLLLFGDGESPLVKIADFGIAKFVGARGKTLTGVGSPLYMAPEQFYDEYDHRTDVYALGVVLFELLHGAPPYAGSPASLFIGHMESPIPTRADLDPDLRRLVEAAMAKKPGDRPTALEFLSAIEATASARGFSFDEPKEAAPPEALAIPARVADSTEADATAAPATDGVAMDGHAPRRAAREAPRPMAAPNAPISLFPSFAGFGRNAPSASAGHATATSLFGPGFGGADRARIVSAEVATAGRTRQARLGGVRVALAWSRAVDSRAFALAACGAGGPRVLATPDSIRELSPDGTSGRTLHAGAIRVAGRSSPWGFAFAGDDVVGTIAPTGEVRLSPLGIAPPDELLALDAEGGVLARRGARLERIDAGGNTVWTRELGGAARGFRCLPDAAGSARVVEIGSPRGTVLRIDGRGEISSPFVAGRPVAAASDPDEEGNVWLLLSGEDCHELALLTSGGIEPVCGLDSPFRHLAGTAAWVCGAAEGGRANAIDPATGLVARSPLAGRTLALARGFHDRQALVLESRDEVLKYVAALDVDAAGGTEADETESGDRSESAFA